MKFLNYLFVVATLMMLLGCRTYKGYREYTEKTELDIKSEKIVDSSYLIRFENKKFEVTEINKIEYIQNTRLDKIGEYIYTDKSGFISHLICSPVLFALGPLSLLTMGEKVVEFQNHQYK